MGKKRRKQKPSQKYNIPTTTDDSTILRLEFPQLSQELINDVLLQCAGSRAVATQVLLEMSIESRPPEPTELHKSDFQDLEQSLALLDNAVVPYTLSSNELLTDDAFLLYTMFPQLGEPSDASTLINNCGGSIDRAVLYLMESPFQERRRVLPLLQIQDEQLASQLHHAPVLQGPLLNLDPGRQEYHGISGKLKLESLYKLFPKLESSEIDSLFWQMNGEYSNVIAGLSAIYPHYSVQESSITTQQLVLEFEKPPRRGRYRRYAGSSNNSEFEDLEIKADQRPYSDIRRDAQLCSIEIDNLFQSAQTAFVMGNKHQGHELVRQCRELNNRRRELNSYAMVYTFQANNSEFFSGRGSYIDLHGLHVNEALRIVKMAIQQRRMACNSSLCIITGRGRHSSNGSSRLFPAVLQYIESKGYSYSTGCNGGEIHVKW